MCGRSRFHWFIRKWERPLKLQISSSIWRRHILWNIQSLKSKSLWSLLWDLFLQQNVAKSPEKDFSRKRRCTLSDTVLTIITMAGHSLRKELDDYFLSNSRSLPSVSAFVQQRANTLLSGRCKSVWLLCTKKYVIKNKSVLFRFLKAALRLYRDKDMIISI